MNQETENFEQLRRLLALKRHEAPPPGYFNDFSRQVIARIKAGERGEEVPFFERLLWEASWLQRLWAVLETKPILAGVSVVAVCGLLISGVIYTDNAEVPPVGLVPVADVGSAPVAPMAMVAAEHPLLAKPTMLLETSSTSPIATAPPEAPFLGDFGHLRAQRATFSLPGAN